MGVYYLIKDSQVLQTRNLVSLKADVTFLGCNGFESALGYTYANLRAERLKVVTADAGAG